MNLLNRLFKRECKHLFNTSDILNIKIEPRCTKCGKTLTELKQQRK